MYKMPETSHSNSGAEYVLIYEPVNNVCGLGIYARKSDNQRIHIKYHHNLNGHALNMVSREIKGIENWTKGIKNWTKHYNLCEYYLSTGNSNHKQITSAIADAVRAILRVNGGYF